MSLNLAERHRGWSLRAVASAALLVVAAGLSLATPAAAGMANGCTLFVGASGHNYDGSASAGVLTTVLVHDPSDRTARAVDARAEFIYDVSSHLVATKGATRWLDDAATAKVPTEWGPGAATRKGVGTRWTDPANPGSGVRIDQGNPLSTNVAQQVDHVIVRHNGVVIGRDGVPIPGSIAEYPELAHVPLDDWTTWTEWFKP